MNETDISPVSGCLTCGGQGVADSFKTTAGPGPTLEREGDGGKAPAGTTVDRVRAAYAPAESDSRVRFMLGRPS